MLKIKTQEIGRSMVEMLGVLAIIGILSIGGVAGYRYAMDRHIANDVLHESNIRGFDVSANFKGRRLPDISEIGGYAKFTGTGKPISVYPNPSDFVWSEYSDKCRSEELCQAFDVEVRGLNKRQCSIIMQSGWDLPDAIMVYKGAASGEGGNIGGEDTAPIAMVSATKPIVQTASSLDSSLCDDFGEEETDIAIRFRFVSTFMDFADEDTETGWEDEGNSDETDDTGAGSSGGSSGGTTEGGSGETGGGEGEGGSGTFPDDDEPVECSGGKEDNGFGICECPTGTTDIGGICKTNCKGGKEFNSAGVCECPDGTTDVKGICRTNCTGNFAFDGEGNCTVCIKNWYGDDCNTFCTATWSNGECLCAGDAYWGGDSCIDCGTNQQVNETKTGCECKSNWYGNDCSVYCDESVATMDGGVCICTDNSKYWNGQSCLSCGTNKVWKNGACACDDTSYPDGEQCIQCPSGTTPTANGCKCDGDNEYWTGDFCLTCDSNATFDAENNECICNTGYYGSGTSCSECKKPRITNETNTECACPNGTNWTGEDTNRCEEPDDGSGGVTDMCDSGLVWDSVNGECVSSSCSSSTTCPHGYVCDITDGRCIRNWNCSNPNALDVSQGKCLDCENRVWTEAGKCTACPSNQTRINGICNCPDSQLFHDATCVDFCPTSAPFVDVRNCVIECPNDKPAPDVNNVCQPCPDGTGWNAETNACELLINDTCVQGMLDAGFDESEFTVVGSEIRVDGDLKLENSLYVPECKLVVNGDLIICKETPDPLWSHVSAGSIKQGELCCPEGQIEQDGECVADIGLTCVTAMTEAGISADKLTREGTTIKYASDMVIENDLDISACDLEVAGTLTINSEITFRVNNITAETSEENGIYVDTNASFFAQGNITGIGLRGINNNGTMECVNMSAIGNGGIQYTTLLNKGVIRATGDVSGSGSTAVGINNQNTLEAKNVTGLTTSNASIGIVNTGVLTVKEIAAGTGHQTGIDNSGTLNAQQVKGIGQATEFAGGVAIINRGQIVAETVIADRQYEANNPMIDENVAALTNESNGVITAYNVYYCRFISNLGKIIGSISCNCTDSTQCSGTTPTACTAPTPVLLGNLTTCVSCKTADSTKPYWNGFACVATCSGDKPVADDTNNICITCAEADDSKPYSDGTQCVAECPAGKPIANNGVCSTECSEDKPLINDGICVTECPTGTTEVSGLCLSDEATVCATEMINAGFNTSDFMMNGMTIKYKDDLMISSNLDISTCNLDVAGTVTVDLDVILKVNNLTAESNDYIGIYNNGGVIEATTATGKSNTEYSGIYNSGILSISGDVIGTSLDDIGVYNEGTMDVEGDIEGISITYIGIENNEGIINAANVIGTSGEDNGIFNSGTITTTGDVIGTSEEADFDGVNNDTTGVIVATNIYYCQTINNDGQIIGKVSCNCVDSTQCVGAEPLVCQMPTPVLSGDLSTCLSCTDADFGMPYWDGNSCVDECPADKPVADEGVCVVNCPENKPFIDEGICLAVCPADKPFSNDGVCVATCPENTTSIDNMCLSETAQSCYTAMSLAEFSIDNFTMQGVTIKYTGDMVIQNSLDISGCNLEVTGTLDVYSGKTLTVNNVKAESISEYGINNYGTIEANSVSGTSESKAGINNYGTIEANNVSGTSKSEVGIDNYDTIDANSVSGISESKAGIDNYGTIEANNVSGTSENGNGIENTHIIKGQNIYYCKTINNTGQIIGSISCNCVDNTQCAGTMPTVCTVPTPVLYSSNQCYSCEDSFLFKPYWNAENGSCQSCIDKNEATPYWNAETDECTVCPDDKPYWSGSACESACPLEKPIYNANKICSSCPVETPYWNGNTCVETCPNDNPAHGNICDIDETSCSYLMSQAGYTDFTVTGNTITYNGEMEISSDLDISVCNLNINGTLYVKSDKTTLKANNIIIKNTFGVYGVRNAGTITANKIIAENLLGAYGIWNDGTITATEIKGVSRSGRGINNANSSVIKANAVIGISTGGTGTDNWGTIEANTVTGNSETSHGLSNWGAIDATTVTGNSETGWGLTNYNTITATTVTGSSLGSQPAISNFEEAVITAENVYYCKKISNTGKITGTISCNCADSTQCSGTAPTQCTAPTPVLSGDLTTCISCETADSTKPYYDGKMCVATCPTETPAPDANNICKTCADIDSTKPIWDAENKTCIACGNGTSWDGVSCVTVCSGDKPVWNAEKGACEACPDEIPSWNGSSCEACAEGTYWNGEACVSAQTYCMDSLAKAGLTNYDYDVTTDTVNYKSDMKITSDLDIYPCNLTTVETLIVDYDVTLKVKDVTGKSTTKQGFIIYAGATVLAENVTGQSTGIFNVGSSLPIGLVNSGTIIATNVTGIAVDSDGLSNFGEIKATVVTGTTSATRGLVNSSLVEAKNIYYCQGITNAGTIVGTISCNCSTCGNTQLPMCTTPDEPVLSSNECKACAETYLFNPVWDETEKACRKCSDIDKYIPYWDGTACVPCPTEQPNWTGTECVATCPMEKPISNDGICEACPEDYPYWDAKKEECVLACQNMNPVYGTICDLENTACSYLMSKAGYTNFTVINDVITHTGNMVVKSDLDISACDLIVKGELYIPEGGILNVGNVSAENIDYFAIYIDKGTLISNGNISGTSKGAEGIFTFSGSKIIASGDIEGKSVSRSGISLGGTEVKARNITGVADNPGGWDAGIYISGNNTTITVTGDVTGISKTSGYGIRISTKNTITAQNVYYCKTIEKSGSATINVTPKCSSGCDCACTTNTQCTGETPLCSGSVCTACPPETPYWSESEGVCVERCDDYIDGNRCVDMCEGDKPYYKQDDNLNKICILPSECKFNLEHTKQCVERCDDGYFISADGKQCVIQCPMDQFIAADGKQCVESCPMGEFIAANGNQCVTECPIGQYIPVEGNICVTECPTGQFIAANGKQCVIQCRYDEYIENNQCTESCSSNKPILDEATRVCQSCAEADSTKPLWDTESKTCIACGNGTSWNGSSCEACSDGTVWNSTECISLKEYCTAKMSGYDSSTYTVSDDGVITYAGEMVIAEDLDISGCDLVVNDTTLEELTPVLTINENVELRVKNLTVTGSSGDGDAIYNYGTVIAFGNVSGSIESAGTQSSSGGIFNANTGSMFVSGDISGSGNTNGINNNGTMKAVSIDGYSSTSGIGLRNSGEIAATTVSGTNTKQGEIDVTYVGLNNLSTGIINATNIYYCKKISNSGKITGTISCNCADLSECGTAPTVCTIDKPVLSGTSCITCELADSTKPYFDGTSCVATCPTGTTADKNNICISETVKSCQEAMINAGFSSNNFTMEDTTIKCNFDVIVERDLDVSGCNLEVDGMLSVYEGVTLRANNVLVNGYTYGIDNAGTIDVVGNVTGAAMFGIVNNGMIKATTVTGMLSAGALGGGTGLINNEIGTITATDIYYCPTMNNLGKIIGKVNCGCPEGDSACGTIPATCSAEEGTPILLGDTCVSCATADLTKPIWNAGNQTCEACAEGTYWNGTSCGTLKEYCTAKMSGYDSSTYTVSDDGVITYTGNMSVNGDLTLTYCNLTVSGDLMVSSGTLTIGENRILKAQNVTAEHASSDGIVNNGTVEVSQNISGTSGGEYSGIENDGILLANGDVVGFSLDGTAIMNFGSLTATNMTGTGYAGIYNASDGFIIAKANIEGTAGPNVGVANEGTIKARGNLVGSSNQDVAISNYGTLEVSGDVVGTNISENTIGIGNAGLITATNAYYCKQIINEGQIIANINCNCEDSTQCEGPETTCTAQTPVLSGDTCVTCETADGSKPYYDGTSCVATCPTGTTAGKNNICYGAQAFCEISMKNAGYDEDYYEVTEDGTVYYIGDMVVSSNLDLSICDLKVDGALQVSAQLDVKNVAAVADWGHWCQTVMTGPSMGYGILLLGGIINATGDVVGVAQSSNSVFFGILLLGGTINATGSVKGYADQHGISTYSGINIITAGEDAVGVARNGVGLYVTEVTAGRNIIGISQNGSVGINAETLTANDGTGMVTYCPTISEGATINGVLNADPDACTNYVFDIPSMEVPIDGECPLHQVYDSDYATCIVPSCKTKMAEIFSASKFTVAGNVITYNGNLTSNDTYNLDISECKLIINGSYTTICDRYNFSRRINITATTVDCFGAQMIMSGGCSN